MFRLYQYEWRRNSKEKKLIINIIDQWLYDEMCKFKTFKFNLCCCLQEKKIRGHSAKLGKGLDFFFSWYFPPVPDD